MAFWQLMIIQVVLTALTVLLVLAGFYRWVLRPYLDRKVAELIAEARTIEPKVTSGVKRGVTESLRSLPEATVGESTRQFLRFGSERFENGLSSFLGTAADLQRRSPGGSAEGRESRSDSAR